jgi:hypothetical protein
MSLSSAWHPQSDGSTERVNRTVEEVLRHYTAPTQDDWDDLLPMVEFAINNAKHSSTKNSPFFLNYGRHPNIPFAAELAKKHVPHAKKFAIKIHDVWAQTNSYLEAASDRMKSYADKQRHLIEFTVGDKVLLSTKNLNPKFGCKKLFPKYIGPFLVTSKINNVAYQLELPPRYRIHNVFHVSLLRPYQDDGRHHPPPAPLEIDGELEYEVEIILLHRKTRSGKLEYYVKWLGYGPEHCSWEPEANLTNCAKKIATYWEKTGEPAKSSTRPNKKTRKSLKQSSNKGIDI